MEPDLQPNIPLASPGDERKSILVGSGRHWRQKANDIKSRKEKFLLFIPLGRAIHCLRALSTLSSSLQERFLSEIFGTYSVLDGLVFRCAIPRPHRWHTPVSQPSSNIYIKPTKVRLQNTMQLSSGEISLDQGIHSNNCMTPVFVQTTLCATHLQQAACCRGHSGDWATF